MSEFWRRFDEVSSLILLLRSLNFYPDLEMEGMR